MSAGPGSRLLLRLLQVRDRLRLRRLARLHPGLRIHPTASSNFAVARFDLAPGAELEIGPGVVTERRAGQVCFRVDAGACVSIGAGSWLYVEVQKIRFAAYAGARISVGRDCWLNGCQLSAKLRVDVEDGAMVGPGTRVYDSDQHPLDQETPEQSAAVRIGACSWVASDVTVMRGAEIGEHCVIGARSLVTGRIEPHSLAFGVPARVHGRVGNRRAFL